MSKKEKFSNLNKCLNTGNGFSQLKCRNFPVSLISAKKKKQIHKQIRLLLLSNLVVTVHGKNKPVDISTKIDTRV